MFTKRLGYEKSTASFFGRPKAKKFNYSSRMNAAILEQVLSDNAAVHENTISGEIEDSLIRTYIPQNPEAAHFACKVNFGKQFDLEGNETKYGIREALTEFSSEEAAGINGKSLHEGNLRMVEYAKRVLQDNRATIDSRLAHRPGKINPIPHMLDNFDSMCQQLEAKASSTADINYSQAAKHARKIEQSLKDDPSFLLSNAFTCVLESWDVLGSLSCTYRFMASALEASTDWTDGPVERIRFANVCEEVMSDWAANKRAVKEAHDAAQLKIYDIADGDKVCAPCDWLVANQEDALYCHFAGVMEIKNGEDYDAPHIIFFLEQPVSRRLSDGEKANILVAANSAWPRLAEVLADEVELEYGSDGGIINMNEYVSSPHVGFFAIHDQNEYPNGRPPYGACIRRSARREDNDR